MRRLLQSAPVSRALIAHRVVQLGLLLTLAWKISFFVDASWVYANIPLDDPFFPSWLRSPRVVKGAYLAAVTAVTLNLFTAIRPLQCICSWLTWIGLTILCVHQGSHNDMTFVTAWWTGLWSLWYVHHLGDHDQDDMLRRAACLSRLILSVILLGGGVGKWTAEYWSGEVLYDIYFRDRDFWAFNLLRENFNLETLREIATWYSRTVVVLETVVGIGLWLMPPRWAAAIGVIVFASIALLSNWYLFSVVTTLIGLAAVGFFVRADGSYSD